jgi:hypothetical protein
MAAARENSSRCCNPATRFTRSGARASTSISAPSGGGQRDARRPLHGLSAGLYGLATVAALLRFLPERDPHPALYETLTVLVDHLDDKEIGPALFVRFEVAILAELGFGLDLATCAATGQRHDLVYVSPKSGRAVSADAGEPYRDRPPALPGFLIGRSTANRPAPEDIRAGFALTRLLPAPARVRAPRRRAARGTRPLRGARGRILRSPTPGRATPPIRARLAAWERRNVSVMFSC